jgi:hypothetical protein
MKNNSQEKSIMLESRSETFRELTPAEKTYDTFNNLACTWNIVTYSSISGALSEKILREALDLLQERHPLLQCVITNSLNHLYFETRKNKKNPLTVIEKTSELDINNLIRSQLNNKIESNKYLFRTVFVHDRHQTNPTHYLITTSHHAISDALCSVQLHSEILKFCSNIISNSSVIQVPKLPILRPLEKLVPMSHQGFIGKLKSIAFLLRIGFKSLLYQPKTLKFEQYVSIEYRRNNFVQRQLDELLTEQLIKTCRQQNITVHGALCSAMLLATAKGLQPREKIPVSCLSIVNLRNRLEPMISKENLGRLISSISSFHILKPSLSFWQLAGEVKQQIETGFHRGDIFSLLSIFKEINQMTISQPKQAFSTVVVSNLGRLNIPKNYGTLKLEEISFLFGQAACGGVPTLAVATWQGKMFLNFIFSEPSLSQKTIEILADDVVKNLRQAISGRGKICAKQN